MKFTILCLLAFFALELASAMDPTPQDFAHLRKESLDQIDEISSTLGADIHAALKAAKGEGKFYDFNEIINCRKPYNKFNADCVQGFRDCQECQDRALAKEDFMLANVCCDEIISKLESRAPAIYQTVTECYRRVFNNKASGSEGHHAGTSNNQDRS